MSDPCRSWVLLMPDLLDGSLSETVARLLRRHLDACGECRALYEELAGRGTAAPSVAPAADVRRLVERVLASFSQDASGVASSAGAPGGAQAPPVAPREARILRFPRRRMFLSAAALVLVVLSAGLVLRPSDPPSGRLMLDVRLGMLGGPGAAPAEGIEIRVGLAEGMEQPPSERFVLRRDGRRVGTGRLSGARDERGWLGRGWPDAGEELRHGDEVTWEGE